jgi:hypothetical protein
MCIVLVAFVQLFEQGGLDHALDFLLTAIAFQSLDRPEAQVSRHNKLGFH